MHVDTIEIHIFDGLLLIGCKFAFAFALEAIVVIVLIWRIRMLIVGCFFIGNAVQDSIVTNCLTVTVLVAVELGVIVLFES